MATTTQQALDTLQGHTGLALQGPALAKVWRFPKLRRVVKTVKTACRGRRLGGRPQFSRAEADHASCINVMLVACRTVRHQARTMDSRMLCTHHEPAPPARAPPHASTKPRRPRQLRPTIGGHHVQLTHSANRSCACRPVPARLCETALGRPRGTPHHSGSSTQGRTGCRVRDHGRAQGHAVRGCGPRGCVVRGPRNSHLQGRPPVVSQHRKRPLWTSLPALGRPRSTPDVRAQQPAAGCKARAEEPAVGHASSATATHHHNTPFRDGTQLSPHAA